MVRSANQLHECPRCDRIVRGPSFFRHIRHCKGKQLHLDDLLQQSPIARYTVSNGTLYSASGRAVGKTP